MVIAALNRRGVPVVRIDPADIDPGHGAATSGSGLRFAARIDGDGGWGGTLRTATLDVFGLVFGCFDFAVDERGQWQWIECNPSGQWGFLPDAAEIADSFAGLLQAG